MMTQQEIETISEALRSQGLTWSQTNFAVSLVRNAIAAEREACARVCEQMNEGQVAAHYDWTKSVGSVIASEIRKRSNAEVSG